MLRTKYKLLRAYKWKVIIFSPSLEKSYEPERLYHNRYSLSWGFEDCELNNYIKFDATLNDTLLDKKYVFSFCKYNDILEPYYIYINALLGVCVLRVTTCTQINSTSWESESLYKFIKDSDISPRDFSMVLIDSPTYDTNGIISYGKITMVISDPHYHKKTYTEISILFDDHILVKSDWVPLGTRFIIRNYPVVEKQITQIRELRCT